MWSSDSDDDNDFVAIWRQRVYKSRVNYGEMEGSYEYTDRFRITAVKTEIYQHGHTLVFNQKIN